MTATRNLPALGFDPTPGDVPSARDIARTLGNMSTELGTVLSNVTGANRGDWKGKSADAFMNHLAGDLQPAVQKCHDSFDQASTLLYRWADQLDGFQAEAARLETEAEAKKSAATSAQSTVNGQPGQPGQAPAAPAGSPQAAQQKTDATNNQKALTDANNAVNDVIRRAHDLHDRFINAAKAIADQLHHAGQLAPGKPGLFDSICNDIGNAFSGAWHWVEQHADAIKFIGDLLSDLSGILAILAVITAPFEPLGAIFAVASAAASGAALLTHLLAMAAGANVSWMTIGVDALGALPGIGMLGKTAKVADEGVAAARAAALSSKLGKTFEASEQVVRHFGGLAKGVENPLLKFGAKGVDVALWGKKTVYVLEHDGSFISRAQAVIESKYALGQTVGVKLLNKIPGIALDPLSGLGRTIDAGIKIVPKLYTVPHGIQKDLEKLGDPFHAMFSAL